MTDRHFLTAELLRDLFPLPLNIGLKPLSKPLDLRSSSWGWNCVSLPHSASVKYLEWQQISKNHNFFFLTSRFKVSLLKKPLGEKVSLGSE